MPVLVRWAQPADRQPALDIWRQANTARGKLPSQERIARVSAKLTDPAAMVLIAIHDNDPVGMTLAEPGLDHDGAGPPVPELCHISMLFVHPHHWGARIGQQLLHAIAEHAARRGHTRLQLWTGLGNQSAQRLYRRAGFRPSGRTRHLDTGEQVIQFVRHLG